MSTVAEVMTLDPRTVQPHHTLADACNVLFEADCGGLPVVDEAGRLLGFLTDRDIAMCGAIQGRSPHELPVRAAMSHEPASIAPTAKLADAHGALRERHVRRLPVVDGEGVVVGLLSLTDLVRDADRDAKGRSKATLLRDTVTELSRSWADIATTPVAKTVGGKSAGGKSTGKKAAAKTVVKKAAKSSAKATTAKPKKATKKASKTSVGKVGRRTPSRGKGRSAGA